MTRPIAVPRARQFPQPIVEDDEPDFLECVQRVQEEARRKTDTPRPADRRATKAPPFAEPAHE